MPFSVLAVRTADDPPTELYPTPADTTDAVELDASDRNVLTHECRSLSAKGTDGAGSPVTTEISELEGHIHVTDARVIVASSKFDKGGGWLGFGLGGLAVAGVANAVSKARASGRRRGKMLVGHVRHEWLEIVMSKDKTGPLSSNLLILIFRNPGGPGFCRLTVDLGKRSAASEVARDIVTRGAPLLAERTEGDAAAVLTAYAERPTYETNEKGFRLFRLPKVSS